MIKQGAGQIESVLIASRGIEEAVTPCARRAPCSGPPASCHCRSPKGMSPVVKDPDCFTPMICHCKVACTNNTLSLMFGCKLESQNGEAGTGADPGSRTDTYVLAEV
ncbi:hypothetical protein PANDA_005555 [Ailuropoda melanoleuca]|uniref:Uncharacterized protein n=1 Tax=Ailuropoda melanoleuca TaxID=9646 RepID=D2H6F5_AILME|nr:hypothetical protein PANDA_005555 [Ailuropoda melanoleuca]